VKTLLILIFISFLLFVFVLKGICIESQSLKAAAFNRIVEGNALNLGLNYCWA